MTDAVGTEPGVTSRRSFLVVAGAGGVALLAAGCGSGKTGSSPTVTSDGAFVQPVVHKSSDGRLELTLRAEAQKVPFGNGTRFAYTYNGSTPGPTLRVRPGDRLVVTLENELDTDTNLHTHGLHVSPSGDADNIFVTVSPGQSHTYTYDIPADHRSGLFWYHPHTHGHVAEQVAAGLAGAIVVTDGIDEISEMASSIERVWVLADPPIGSDAAALVGVSGMSQMQGRQGDRVFVNGISQPDVAAAAGGLERWRLVNASASRYYRLVLDGHQLHAIASDGGRLAAPVAVDELMLAPGERTELLVTPTKPGTYRLQALAYDRGTAGMGGGMGNGMGGRTGSSTAELTIATMTVTGNSGPAALPSQLVEPGSMSPTPATSTRTLELAMGMGNGSMMGGGGSMMGFTIDGKTFDPARTDITVSLGAVEEWTIRNTSPMDHPFHLHVWPFQVIDGRAPGGWKDTVNVPANSELRIRIPFTGIVGRTVYHCHILDHEDLGMMGVIDVAG